MTGEPWYLARQISHDLQSHLIDRFVIHPDFQAWGCLVFGEVMYRTSQRFRLAKMSLVMPICSLHGEKFA